MSKRKSPKQIMVIKNAVLEKIKNFGFSVEKRKDLGNSIYALNSNTIIDLIYSSYDPASKKYFFGIEEEQFHNAYKNNRNYFQVFICENLEQVFFIPLSLMVEIVKDAKANDHITFRQWKPVIKKRNGIFILRLNGIYEITDYLNRYDYLISEENQFQLIRPTIVKFNSEIEVKSETQKFKELADDFGLDKKDIHNSTIQMLKNIGEWLGYKVLTESRLSGIDKFPYQIDCLWYKDNDLYLAIEVCNKGSVEKDKDALKQARHFGARKVIIITDIAKLERIRSLFMYNGEIKSWTEVWTFKRVFNMFENGKKFFKDFSKFREHNWSENITEYL